MRKWLAFVRARVANLEIPPTTEIDVTEEIAQHLEDRFDDLCQQGLSADEAAARVAAELDGDDFPAALTSLFPRRPS